MSFRQILHGCLFIYFRRAKLSGMINCLGRSLFYFYFPLYDHKAMLGIELLLVPKQFFPLELNHLSFFGQF